MPKPIFQQELTTFLRLVRAKSLHDYLGRFHDSPQRAITLLTDRAIDDPGDLQAQFFLDWEVELRREVGGREDPEAKPVAALAETVRLYSDADRHRDAKAKERPTNLGDAAALEEQKLEEAGDLHEVEDPALVVAEAAGLGDLFDPTAFDEDVSDAPTPPSALVPAKADWFYEDTPVPKTGGEPRFIVGDDASIDDEDLTDLPTTHVSSGLPGSGELPAGVSNVEGGPADQLSRWRNRADYLDGPGAFQAPNLDLPDAAFRPLPLFGDVSTQPPMRLALLAGATGFFVGAALAAMVVGVQYLRVVA